MDILDKIKKQIEETEKSQNQQLGQNVPEGYFDTLEDKLISLIPEEKPARKTISMWSLGAIAAAVCLVLVAVFTIQPEDTVIQQPLALNEVSSEESVQFLLSVNENLENEDLLEIENIDEILEEMQDEIDNQTN